MKQTRSCAHIQSSVYTSQRARITCKVFILLPSSNSPWSRLYIGYIPCIPNLGNLYEADVEGAVGTALAGDIEVFAAFLGSLTRLLLAHAGAIQGCNAALPITHCGLLNYRMFHLDRLDARVTGVEASGDRVNW